MKRSPANFLSLLILSCSVLALIFAFAPGNGISKGLSKNGIENTPVMGAALALNAEEGDTNKIDVLKDAKALNGPNAPKPGKKFRQGHMTPGTIKDYLKTTDYGFVMDFHNTTQVPTPTIYNGRIYVGGGFGSKIFHCFDAKTGKHIWTKNLDDDGPSSAVIVDDIAVFNTESCTIFACDAKSGKMLWSYWLGDPLMSMPTVANGKVFTAYPAGHGGGFNNFQKIEQIQTEDFNAPDNSEFNGSPDDGFGPSDDEEEDENEEKTETVTTRLRPTHVLICMDLKTGKIEWQKWIDGDVMSAPVAHGEDLMVVTFPGTFYKFRQSDGEILAATASRATSAPVVVGNDIYFSKRADGEDEEASETFASARLSKLNDQTSFASTRKKADYLNRKVQDGTTLKTASISQDAGNGFGSGAPATSGWEKAADNIGYSNVSSLQAFQGARILNHRGNNYSVRGDELVCVPEKGGEPLWNVKLSGDMKKSGGFLGTPPLVVGGKLIIGTLSGDIILYDAKSGKEEKRYEIGIPIRQQPVVQDGWIYAGTTQGKVVAINTGDKKLTGWPVWGGDAAHSGIPTE